MPTSREKQGEKQKKMFAWHSPPCIAPMPFGAVVIFRPSIFLRAAVAAGGRKVNLLAGK